MLFGNNPKGLSPAMQAQYMSDPRMALAMELQKSGGSSEPIRTTGGGMANMLAKMVGAYQNKQLRDEYTQRSDEYNQTLAKAMQAGVGTPAQTNLPGPTMDGSAGYDKAAVPGDMQAMINILSQNPDTAGMGAKMGLEYAVDKAKRADKNAMLAGLLGGGAGGDNASKLAMAGVLTGDRNLIELGKFKHAQKKDSPEYKAEVAEKEKVAKLRADKIDSYNSMRSKLPQLLETTDKLSKLGEDATYTSTGQGVDWLVKETGPLTGITETPGSIARKEFNARVSNQVLPLLRDTFGAAFTKAEGDSLRQTLGDPDASPAEKNAVLRAFIEQKIADVNASASELGYEPINVEIPESLQQKAVEGTGGPSGALVGGRLNYADPMVQEAFDNGYTSEQIMQFLGKK